MNRLIVNDSSSCPIFFEIYAHLIFGGANGVSNQDNSTILEAIKMKELALSLGINEEDILIDDTSNNTF